MILLLGRDDDPVIGRLAAALQAAGHPFTTVDPNDHPDIVQVELVWTAGKLTGTMSIGPQIIAMEEIRGVFDRSGSTAGRPGPDGDPRGPGADLLLAEFLSQVPALVINHPRAQATNAAKPYQYGAARASGLAVPPTLVTSDPNTARDFLECHGDGVIFKSISAVRSKVRRLDAAAAERLDLIRHGPVQLQEHIVGQDVRVHVVAAEVFARAVVSTAQDYRYPQNAAEAARLEPFTLPDAVSDSCVSLADRLGLSFAGIDLRRRPDGHWVCFEANTQPAYTFYEPKDDDRVTLALVRLLTTGRPRGDTQDEHLVAIATDLRVRTAPEASLESSVAGYPSPFIGRELRPDPI